MGLKINNKKQLVCRAIWILIAVILGACMLKIVIWEFNYYREKEGSERSVVNRDTGEEVDETEVTIADIQAHTVAPDLPRYLSIESLNIINARVKTVGLKDDGQLATPVSIYDVGWYDLSAKPGTGGTVVMDGHNGGPTKTGVFKDLPSLKIGDTVIIERGDGVTFHYEVVENKTVALEDADTYMAKMEVSPTPGVESLSLITCTGEWSDAQKTYLSRQFVRAVLRPSDRS